MANEGWKNEVERGGFGRRSLWVGLPWQIPGCGVKAEGPRSTLFR
jgi:hypothetical protein